MKKLTTIALTALVAATTTIAAPVQASSHLNVSTGVERMYNDNDPHLYLSDDLGNQAKFNIEDQRYPLRAGAGAYSERQWDGQDLTGMRELLYSD
jgi:hypothetical protein